METTVKQKAALILAGLAAMPAIASAGVAKPQSYSYSEPGDVEEVPGDTQLRTGLSKAELQEGAALAQELNGLNIVTVTGVKLEKAPLVPYRYNMPLPEDVEKARAANLERLAKLRAMIEAAK